MATRRRPWTLRKRPCLIFLCRSSSAAFASWASPSVSLARSGERLQASKQQLRPQRRPAASSFPEPLLKRPLVRCHSPSTQTTYDKRRRLRDVEMMAADIMRERQRNDFQDAMNNVEEMVMNEVRRRA